jgi:hypothetical protein
MKLILPKYAMNYDLLPFKTEEEAKELGLTFEQPLKNEGGVENYVIQWGLNSYIPNYGAKYGVMETGFFHEASFIDTVGNYQSLSLNIADGYRVFHWLSANLRLGRGCTPLQSGYRCFFPKVSALDLQT